MDNAKKLKLAGLVAAAGGLVWYMLRKTTPSTALPEVGTATASARNDTPLMVLKPTKVDAIREAYDRNGGAQIVGHPTAPAIAAAGGRGFVQTYAGSGGYPAAIFARTGESKAYVVRGGFYALHTRLGHLKVGWPLGDERTVKASGLQGGTSYQEQKFSNGIVFTWNSKTKRVTASFGTRVLYDSAPPPPKEAWYEAPWTMTATLLSDASSGLVAIVMDSADEAKELALKIATDPKVLLQVGIAVVAVAGTVATAGIAAPILVPVATGAAGGVAAAVGKSAIEHGSAMAADEIKQRLSKTKASLRIGKAA